MMVPAAEVNWHRLLDPRGCGCVWAEYRGCEVLSLSCLTHAENHDGFGAGLAKVDLLRKFYPEENLLGRVSDLDRITP